MMVSILIYGLKNQDRRFFPEPKTQNPEPIHQLPGRPPQAAFVPGAEDLLAFFHEPGVLALGAGRSWGG